ncbi:MAG: metallophosphoesterase family protein [bacterium]
MNITSLPHHGLSVEVLSMLSRIGIIGDVHAQDQYLHQALDHLTRLGVDHIICTGDIADGPGDIHACINLLLDYNVDTVRGNHDRWVLQNKARHIPDAHRRETLHDNVICYLQDLPLQIELETKLGTLLLCHGVGSNDLQKIWPGTDRMPAERSARLDDIIAKGDTPLMVNGHLHYRTLIHFDSLTLLNAGTLRGRHRPGFSLIDLDADEVHGFELEPKIHEVKRQPLSPTLDVQVFKNTQHFDDQWQPVTLYA